MPLRKYIRRNVYKWHRLTSLIVALPILLWTLSGFLHPIMSAMKPEVKNQSLKPVLIDTSKIRIGLREALLQNGITRLHNFRIVKMYGAFYYQVQQPGADSLNYISCYNAQWLPKGDEQYAAWLAQRYMTEGEGKNGSAETHHEPVADTRAMIVYDRPRPTYERYNVKEVELVKDFNSEYRRSNVLLPVYKVSFYRGDNIRLYIETSTDRLATAIDNRKALFTRFFSAAHSWSFLDGLGITKNILLASVSLLCFLTALLGFYVYNITNKKKTSIAGQKNKNRHRLLGNIFVATTMLYALSGAWHSFHKMGAKKDVQNDYDQTVYTVADLHLPVSFILQKLEKDEMPSGISIARIKNKNYWQVSVNNKGKKFKKYFETGSLGLLHDGDRLYAGFLACRFAGKPEQAITEQQMLGSFDHQYSMMNKRLPVVKTAFDNNLSYYVETGTGKLAAVTSESDKAERFSFSNFHMHHYWEMWLPGQTGKSMRNLILITSTLGLLLLALTGILLWLRKQKRKG